MELSVRPTSISFSGLEFASFFFAACGGEKRKNSPTPQNFASPPANWRVVFKNTGVNKCRKSAIHSEDGGLNDALKLARRLIKYTKKDTDNTR